MKDQIIVRFPPSPTGFLHMGNVRTAIYNYLFARQNGGKFLLRIEDTDKERSKREYEKAIYEDIAWLGLDYDNKGEVWRSSERTEIYKQKIQELIKKGTAYISEESEGENKQVVRFRNPGGKIKFQDLIRGEIEMEVGDLNDFIIARNIDDPLYHLAVSVDDAEAGVTHIIRGDDHIANTPRQILIIEALGGARPVYVHLPLVLAPDKSKLSKRKHGESVSLKYYRDRGYEREAIINFLAMIGWNPGTDKEVFTLEELKKEFDISKVQKKGGIFNIEKLDWINKEHIMRQSKEDQISKLKEQIERTKCKDKIIEKDENFFGRFLSIILERIHRWGEVGEIIGVGEFDYIFETPEVKKETLIWRGQSLEKTKEILEEVVKVINKQQIEFLDEDNFDKSHPYKNDLDILIEKYGIGNVLWPMRIALCGKQKSPSPFDLVYLLGFKESKKRIEKIINEIG